MSHPLRLEIMERVGRRGTARAADIAADLGVPANSVSYHLRILARGGVIEEAPEAARDRRDRVWRLAQGSFEHGGSPASLNDPSSAESGYKDASGATSLAAFEWVRSAWSAEFGRYLTQGRSPQDHFGSMFATSMRLSPAQVKELNSVVSSKLLEFQALNRDEHGANVPGDPDSEGEATDFRVMWVSVAAPSPGSQARSS